jgi:hypothetical protein
MGAGGLAIGLSLLLVLGAGCAAGAHGSAAFGAVATTTSEAVTSAERDPDVPQLPFPDNPDPSACGIPTLWGNASGRLTGIYQGQLVEPTVYLYDSHLRNHITAALPSGTPVQVELYQSNPVLDFYYVRAETPDGPRQGWVPAPFLQLNPPSS